MTIDKKTIRQVILGVAGCILLYWLLHSPERVNAILGGIWKIFAPFGVGAALAFVLNVPMRAIEKCLNGIKKDSIRRGLGILLTFVAVLVVLTAVVWLVIPQVVDTVESLVAVLPDFFRRVYESAVEFVEEHPDLQKWLADNTDFETVNWSEWLQRILSWMSSSLTDMVDKVLGAVVSFSTGIFNGVLSLVFGIYCLARKEILARQGRRILYSFLPEKVSDEIIRILRMTNATFSRFLSGQCLEALILGSMFAVTMPIFGMPFMPLISVVIAVTALVPIVGAFVGCVLGAFFILVQNPVLAFWFVVMFLILQQIEGNLIYPRVVGSSIGLPGMWVLVAVAVGGDLMGIGGMLLMIPLASVMYALAREITNNRLAAKGIDPDKLRDHPPELTSKFKEKRKEKKAQRLQKRAEKQQEMTGNSGQ